MKILIALVGEPLAGKETVGNFMRECAERDNITFVRHRFRDPLEETLKLMNRVSEEGADHKETLKNILALWSIPESQENTETLARTLDAEYAFNNWASRFIDIERESLQLMPQIMRRPDAFGAYALTNAIRSRAIKATADAVNLDGVRWLTDEEMLRSVPGSVLLYITADFETRFARLKARKRDANETKITRERFYEQHKTPTEIDIPAIGSRADWKIENNTNDPEDLRSKTEEFWQKMALPLLKPGK